MREYKQISKIILLSCVFVFTCISSAFSETGDIEYKSGIYNDVQMMPNFFATYCGYNAEELVEDQDKRNHCINKLGVYVNPDNAIIKAEHRQEYTQNVVAEGIRVLAASTTAKNASIPDLREGVADLATTATQSTTIHDDNKGHNLALGEYQKTLKAIRELMAESNLNTVINDLNNMDGEVIIESARDESNILDTSIEEAASSSSTNSPSSSNSTNSTNGGSGKGDNNASKNNGNSKKQGESLESFLKEYTVDNPYVGKWLWVESNTCSRAICTGKGNTEAALNCTYERDNCPDGAYSTSVSNKIVSCEKGKCEVLSTRDEDICGMKSLVLITKLQFAYQSGNQPAVCTNGETFTLCRDGKYKISGQFYYACLNGKCVECLGE